MILEQWQKIKSRNKQINGETYKKINRKKKLISWQLIATSFQLIINIENKKFFKIKIIKQN